MPKLPFACSMHRWVEAASLPTLLSTIMKFFSPFSSTFPIPARRSPVVESCSAANSQAANRPDKKERCKKVSRIGSRDQLSSSCCKHEEEPYSLHLQ